MVINSRQYLYHVLPTMRYCYYKWQRHYRILTCNWFCRIRYILLYHIRQRDRIW